jgi:hypothetical protein
MHAPFPFFPLLKPSVQVTEESLDECWLVVLNARPKPLEGEFAVHHCVRGHQGRSVSLQSNSTTRLLLGASMITSKAASRDLLKPGQLER